MPELDDVFLEGHPLANFERTVHTSLPPISLSPAPQACSSQAQGCLAKTSAQPGIHVTPSHLPAFHLPPSHHHLCSVQQKDFPSSLLQ